MFKRKHKLSFVSEDLAVPEIVTDEVKEEKKTELPEEDEKEVLYDTVAIPEYNPHHKK